MKRFIFGIATSIVFISIGAMLTVFELKDFRFVNAYSRLYDDVQTYETTVTEADQLRIDLEEFVTIDYDIDNTMKDEVEIDVAENIDHTFNNNRLKVSDYSWISFPFGKYIDVMIDGLKEEKIYYFEHNDQKRGGIVIRCSEKTRDYIRISE